MSRQTAWFTPGLLILALSFVGCQPSSQTEQTQPETAQTPAGQKGGGAKKPAARAPAERRVTIPAGTTLDVRLDDVIDTGKTSEGSSFTGTLAGPVSVNGVEVAGVGAVVTGNVTHAVSAGRLKRPAELSLVLDSLTTKGGGKVDISTDAWSAKGESHTKRNAEMIGGGAAAGALVGALVGGKKGAGIGALAGGGGGTAAAAYTGKKEIILPAETKLSFKLSSSVSVAVRSRD